MAEDLSQRTKGLALRVVRLYAALPQTDLARTLGKQLLRSGTSVGANYREAKWARSPAEFASKLQVVLQELEETHYWLELLIEAEIVKPSLLAPLLDETQQLIAIFVSSVNTAKKNS